MSQKGRVFFLFIYYLFFFSPVSLSGPLPNVLQEAQVPLVDQGQCQQQLPEYTITSSMLCAGFPEGGVDSCQVEF